jgi:hypothetical protein
MADAVRLEPVAVGSMSPTTRANAMAQTASPIENFAISGCNTTASGQIHSVVATGLTPSRLRADARITLF